MISTKSYAKINLVLNVSDKNENGYHNLDSIVLPLELHDTIVINKLKDSNVNLVTIDDFSSGYISYNIASMALDRLYSIQKYDEHLRILIHKVIPMQAGLGGGSSNAAFTMKAVNNYLNLNISKEVLYKTAKSLGADVPFFIDCKPARMQGIGEKLTPITVKNNYSVLIVKPADGLSTKDIYEKGDSMKLPHYDVEGAIEALASGDDDKLAECVGNALEVPSIELLPEIGKIKDLLKSYGLKIVSMTGSGSAVFALSQDTKLLKQIKKDLEDTYTVILTKVLK